MGATRTRQTDVRPAARERILLELGSYLYNRTSSTMDVGAVVEMLMSGRVHALTSVMSERE